METYFASPERASKKELIAEIEIANKSPVISGLLNSISGLLAILDEHRQIVALNDSFLQMLGIDDPSEALGLRPGEAVNCIHAHEEPAGCGTTKFCSTCGAAIAIVASLGEDKPVERICALTAQKGEQTIDISLLVRSQPIKVEGKRFLLLFIQDITLQQHRAALERTFFHDVNNTLTALVAASEILSIKNPQSKLVNTLHLAALRLKNEIAIQKHLLQGDSYIYKPLWGEVKIEQIIEELKSFFANHPVAQNKNLHFQSSCQIKSFKTDISLLLRILCNMITNAFEATKNDREIKIWVEDNGNSLSFFVWNHMPIPENISHRIFQRNFSTKEGDGRGVGTFSMKLFGEQILGGKVSFTSSKEEGTTFRFTLPL